MTNAMTTFTKQMRTKLDEVEFRLKTLKAETDQQIDHAEKAIRAHVDTLEAAAEHAKHSLDHARADVSGWIDDTKEAVAGWKTRFDTTMLQARAARYEHYAQATLVVALADVDRAEKAMLSAGLARDEANATRAK
ncbi:hypothetical protein [Novosphingobium sp.]|uniref:hypothetical protein n=1 Tax=Novosphingobium sp. TaxID=1874826 RepID=UPI0033402220